MADEHKLDARKSRKQNGRRTSTIGEPCPICLSDLKDPTILSDCSHIFCYDCIIEWLKMKPECPLCKQSPKSFKHTLQLNNKFVKPTWSDAGKEVNLQELLTSMEMELIVPRSSYPADVERHAVMEVINQINREQRILRSMAHSAAGRESIYTTAVAELGTDLLSYEHVLNMFPVASRRDIFSEPAFRRVLYLRNLSPRSIVPPRYSVVFNLDYIKAHEHQLRVHLLPYIAREVAALTGKGCAGENVMDRIFDYFLNKKSRLQIVTYLSEQGIRHPHQFLNNLMHFASTGQALVIFTVSAVYDQNSEYVPRSSTPLLTNVGGNDDVFVVNSIVNNDVQVVGESTTSGNGMRSNSQRVEIQTRDGVSQAMDRRRQQNPSNSIVDLSSSDSDSDTVAVENDQNINGESRTNNPSAQRFDNYVYTPTTDSWRRDVPRIMQPPSNRAINAIQMIQRYLSSSQPPSIETSSQRGSQSTAFPANLPGDHAMDYNEDGDNPHHQRGHVYQFSQRIPHRSRIADFAAQDDQPSSSRNVRRHEEQQENNDHIAADIIDLSDSLEGTEEVVEIKRRRLH